MQPRARVPEVGHVDGRALLRLSLQHLGRAAIPPLCRPEPMCRVPPPSSRAKSRDLCSGQCALFEDAKIPRHAAANVCERWRPFGHCAALERPAGAERPLGMTVLGRVGFLARGISTPGTWARGYGMTEKRADPPLRTARDWRAGEDPRQGVRPYVMIMPGFPATSSRGSPADPRSAPERTSRRRR
jgi:hypothetical protein